uniref:Uncharacterized protein n=1 Tax=Dechloromonas aromatica (strain RCB) TaxID=159087 RepID=Q47C82_DECAR
MNDHSRTSGVFCLPAPCALTPHNPHAICRTCLMEQTLPEDHPDMIRIVQAAHHDVVPKPPKGQANSLANALASALGSAPGSGEDLENIEFLVHVLSVNRASGAIADDTFEQLLQVIKTKDGRAGLASRFADELEVEHGYEDED